MQNFDPVTRFLSGWSRAEIGKKIRFSSVFSNFQRKNIARISSLISCSHSAYNSAWESLSILLFDAFLVKRISKYPFCRKARKWGKIGVSWRLLLLKQFLTLLILIFVISLIGYILPDEFWKNKQNESFREIQKGTSGLKALTERFHETKCLETSLSIP